MNIYLQRETPTAVAEARLRAAALTVLQQQGAEPNAAVSLVLTDDAALQALNRTYRGVDAPTDVLSFEAHVPDPETGEMHLGEVLISVQRAAAQAARAGHSLDDELLLLTVHGVLHLLGFDHAETEEKARMWAAQRQALAAFGLESMHISEI